MSRRELLGALLGLLALTACESDATTMPRSVTEPTIRNIGPNRILVEIPAVTDPTEAKRLLKEIAALRSKMPPSGYRR